MYTYNAKQLNDYELLQLYLTSIFHSFQVTSQALSSASYPCQSRRRRPWLDWALPKLPRFKLVPSLTSLMVAMFSVPPRLAVVRHWRTWYQLSSCSAARISHLSRALVSSSSHLQESSLCITTSGPRTVFSTMERRTVSSLEVQREARRLISLRKESTFSLLHQDVFWIISRTQRASSSITYRC